MTDNLAIENTLAAFANSISLGYRYIETDVHATADGVLVVFHDDDLARVSGESGKISSLRAKDLKSVRVGGAEPIPTLDELLDSFPEVRINIDIKMPAAVEPLAETIKRHSAQKRVCVASFSASRLRRFCNLAGPDVATAATPLRVGLSSFMPSTITMKTPSAPVWQMPLTTSFLGRKITLASHRLVDELHRLGKRIHIWTIDDPQIMHNLIDMGVDGIFTDRPDVLRKVLLTRGMWYA